MSRKQAAFILLIRFVLPILILSKLSSCNYGEQGEPSIYWLKGKASGILIPSGCLRSGGKPEQDLEVHLKGQKQKMLGILVFFDQLQSYCFQPPVPLTTGLTYEIFDKGKKIGEVSVELPGTVTNTSVVNVFPSADTLPANLLKFYVSFSSPMREGEALDHIHLLDNKGDTLHDIFLDLQPELWNQERTQLTLWLDPGRIKRDLIPNRKLGNPLTVHHSYKLVVSGNWKDQQGIPLKSQFEKAFYVTNRDDHSPEPSRWMIEPPQAGTTEPLIIRLNEPLDFYLLRETIAVNDDAGKMVSCKTSSNDRERSVSFQPSIPWSSGSYHLRIDPKLEDLAGNNLNRPFDRDIKKQPLVKDSQSYDRVFMVH